MQTKWFMRGMVPAMLLTVAVAAHAEKPWGEGRKGGDPMGDMDGGWGKHGERGDRGERGDNDDDQKGPRQPLTQVQKDEILAFIKEIDADRIKQLEKLQSERPELYEKVLAAGYGKMKRLKELKGKDGKAYDQQVQLFVLQGKVRDLAKNYRMAKTDSDQKKIKAELDGLLNKLFDLRQTEKEQELARFQKRLQKFEADVQKRKANKDQVIKLYADKLLGDSDGLEW